MFQIDDMPRISIKSPHTNQPQNRSIDIKLCSGCVLHRRFQQSECEHSPCMRQPVMFIVYIVMFMMHRLSINLGRFTKFPYDYEPISSATQKNFSKQVLLTAVIHLGTIAELWFLPASTNFGYSVEYWTRVLSNRSAIWVGHISDNSILLPNRRRGQIPLGDETLRPSSYFLRVNDEKIVLTD